MNIAELSAIATIIAIFVSAAISYGVTKGTLNGVKDRVSNLEKNKWLTREEYENRHSELRDYFSQLVEAFREAIK